jgi:hypothetical protein
LKYEHCGDSWALPKKTTPLFSNLILRDEQLPTSVDAKVWEDVHCISATTRAMPDLTTEIDNEAFRL